jgi:hypothetical protein
MELVRGVGLLESKILLQSCNPVLFLKSVSGLGFVADSNNRDKGHGVQYLTLNAGNSSNCSLDKPSTSSTVTLVSWRVKVDMFRLESGIK